MKTITVWINRGNDWEILHQGPEPVRVKLAEEDQEASQIESVVFDPNAPEIEEELPWLELAE
jgi:hypothetical protein